MRRPLFIGSEIYRGSIHGRNHPLSIPRVSSTIDLCRAMGWLGDGQYVDSPRATPAQLARFHDPDYIATLMRVEAEQRAEPEVRARYNLGKLENPIYPQMFRRPATACGASIHAAALLAEGGIVHSPAGGTHHGRRDRASGFCFFNDPVLGIYALLDQGLARVCYVDIDAHHGDGVEIAFAGDPRVRTISVHEDGRWPHTGRAGDRAGGSARNLPVPPGFNDSEMAFVVDAALVPLARDFAPAALVLQCGVDGLADDPMSKLRLSNRAYWYAVERLMGVAPRLLVLGGGGYNPWAVARCWAGVWATLNGLAIPDGGLPEAAEAVLRGLAWSRSEGRNPPAHWMTTIADKPRLGAVRPAVREVVARALADDPALPPLAPFALDSAGP
ncbi:MAG: acetoin utilization protein AcuC [Alphaproteobacteria bacterium]|nr:acetoin utilization protein AcuC [Alphaproteobacteria bacterium]